MKENIQKKAKVEEYEEIIEKIKTKIREECPFLPKDAAWDAESAIVYIQDLLGM